MLCSADDCLTDFDLYAHLSLCRITDEPTRNVIRRHRLIWFETEPCWVFFFKTFINLKSLVKVWGDKREMQNKWIHRHIALRQTNQLFYWKLTQFYRSECHLRIRYTITAQNPENSTSNNRFNCFSLSLDLVFVIFSLIRDRAITSDSSSAHLFTSSQPELLLISSTNTHNSKRTCTFYRNLDVIKTTDG